MIHCAFNPQGIKAEQLTISPILLYVIMQFQSLLITFSRANYSHNYSRSALRSAHRFFLIPANVFVHFTRNLQLTKLPSILLNTTANYSLRLFNIFPSRNPSKYQEIVCKSLPTRADIILIKTSPKFSSTNIHCFVHLAGITKCSQRVASGDTDVVAR